jgi:hypothetical protein
VDIHAMTGVAHHPHPMVMLGSDNETHPYLWCWRLCVEGFTGEQAVCGPAGLDQIRSV